jgi:hypothetical protein
MAGDPLAPPSVAQTAAVVSRDPRNPWKPISIALALLLAAVLIAVALVATDIMKLGFSLL